VNFCDSLTKSEIKNLNKRIKKQNKKDIFKKSKFYININILCFIRIEAGITTKSLEKNLNNKQAKKIIRKTKEIVQKNYLNKLISTRITRLFAVESKR
jgi:uncharacterized membrane protein YheB (UPF0754 family)